MRSSSKVVFADRNNTVVAVSVVAPGSSMLTGLANGTTLASEAIYLSPSGTSFDPPVQLDIPLASRVGGDGLAEERHATRLAIHCFDPVHGVWQERPGTVVDVARGLASVRTGSFSSYAVLEVPAAPSPAANTVMFSSPAVPSEIVPPLTALLTSNRRPMDSLALSAPLGAVGVVFVILAVVAGRFAWRRRDPARHRPRRQEDTGSSQQPLPDNRRSTHDAEVWICRPHECVGCSLTLCNGARSHLVPQLVVYRVLGCRLGHRSLAVVPGHLLASFRFSHGVPCRWGRGG